MAEHAGDPDFDIVEFNDQVHYEVESRHQVHETWCTCGFKSFVSRERTEHIVSETLIAAGLEERESNG